MSDWKTYEMACGDVVRVYGSEKPICRTHSCEEVVKECSETHKLEGRVAKCSYCKTSTPSNWGLPFFQNHKDKDYDEYYCGCRGWD